MTFLNQESGGTIQLETFVSLLLEGSGPTVPAAPTIGTATAASTQVTLPFSTNGNGGSAILDFTATLSPGAIQVTVSASPAIFTGLTNGVSYSGTVHARNAIGNSAESGTSNSVTPSGVSNLMMYSNGVLNALFPSGQDLSYNGTTYAPAWSGSTAYVVGNLVSATGISGQVYKCIVANTGAAFPGADWLAVGYPDNYLDATVVDSPHTKSLSLTGQFAGWQQGANWPRPDQGGTNGLDISAYTQIEFDYWQPSSNGINGLQFHYCRSTGNDIGESTQFTGTTLTNIVGALANGSWNKNLKVPLCFLGGLSKYNLYKLGVQNSLSGQTPIYFDNFQYVTGSVSWVYRGNAGLESGWTDASSGATITYNFSAQTISASFYSLNEPSVPMANFTGVMTAGGSLSVSGVTNTIKIGMWVFGATVPNSGGVSLCQITGGSGSSWTVTNGANISSASMTCGFLQTQVGIVKWAPLGTSSYWQTNYVAGFNTAGFSQYTVSLLPTQSGYAYTAQAVNTLGALIGSSVNLSAYTPADNGVSTSHWTVYSVPLASMGISNTTIGGIRITDTSGHTATIYACADGLWS